MNYDKRKKYYMILDCETATLPCASQYEDEADRKTIAITKPLIYDLGWKIVDRMGKEWVEQIKRTELARATYRKDKTIENADKLLACVEGGKYYG